VPLIAGWDLSRGGGVAKVYLNASDAAESVRRGIAERLAWPGLDRLPAPPHVAGINASQRELERKAYLQERDAPPPAGRAGGAVASPPAGHEPSRWLADRAKEHALHGGTVTSWDLGEHGATARAFFVALRGEAGALLSALPGWDEAAVDRALPFARGQCRSIGVDLRTNANATWTAYFKPAHLGVPLWSIEPSVRYRSGDLRVAVFVAPADFAGRAYARTKDHAVSFRGEIPRDLFDPLARWVLAELERGGEAALRSPPPPWAVET
jgi:hypothetical protein